MRNIFKAAAVGLVVMTASLSASATEYSLTISDNSPGDTLEGSSITGTLDFGNSIPSTGSGTVFDTAPGTWTYTVTAATGSSEVTALLGDVFYDNAFPTDSSVNYANGQVSSDISTASLYYFTDSVGNQLYSYDGSPSIYFNVDILYADLANNDYAYPNITPLATPVPEPASMALLASGIAGLAALRRRRRG